MEVGSPVRSVGVMVALLVVLWGVALAQPARLSLNSMSPQRVRPGEFVTAVFALQNAGEATETFAFELDLPEGFALVSPLAPLTLPPGADELVFVTALVPQTAAAGPVTLMLTARAEGDPAVALAAEVELDVVAASGLRLSALAGQTERGGTIRVSFRLDNRGNAPDEVTLAANSAAGFPVTIEPDSLFLDPGSGTEIAVAIHLPPGAGAERASDRVTLTATSERFAGARAQASRSLRLRPPAPDEVETFLGWSMPAAISLAITGGAREGEDATVAALARFEGGGEFRDGHALRTRWSVDRSLEFDDLLLALETPRFDVRVGDVSTRFDAFAALGGRGVALTARSPDAPDAAAFHWVGIAERDPFPTGAGVALTVLETELSVSAVARLGGAETTTLLSARVARAFSEAVSLTTQAAVHHEAGRWDSALDAAIAVARDDWSTDVTFARAGPDFPHASADRAWLGLVHTLSLARFSLLGSARFARVNVRGESGVPTTDTAAAKLVFQGAPGPRLPSLFGAVSYDASFSLDGPLAAERQTLVGSLSARQPLEVASVLLELELERRIDASNASNASDVGSLVFGGVLGWNVRGFSRTLGLFETLSFDHASGHITEQSPRIEATAAWRTPLGRVSFRMEHRPPRTELRAGLDARLDETRLNLSSEVTLAPATPADFEARLRIARRFGLPVLFIPVRGQIVGTAFVDANGNSRPDSGEGVADLIVAGGGARVRTDADGFYRLPPLAPGNYRVSLEAPPSGTVPTRPLPVEVELGAGRRVGVDLPLRRVSIVDGRVFDDADRDGKRDPSEAGLGDVRIVLTGTELEARVTRSTVDGRFSFVDLPPGDYTVRLDEGALPPRFELTTPNPVEVAVGDAGRVEVRFGAAERQPEIRITTSAPSAAFSVAPEEPRTGDTVSFDASASNDPDGEIVDYAWDFNDDGDVDATGVRVEFVFEQPGEVHVTLTVTDDSGNSAQASRVIRIWP